MARKPAPAPSSSSIRRRNIGIAQTRPRPRTPPKYSKPPNRQVLINYPFPPELFRNILEWITDTEDLCNLSLTSRICRIEAERVLYHSIELAQNSTAPVLWANTMLSCPHKAQRVRALTLKFDTSFLIVPEMLVSSLHVISQALRKLNNLKNLILGGHSLAMMHPIYTWILDDCPFSLDVFHNFVFPAPSIVPFLSRQPNIREWKQAGSHIGETLDESFLPQLAILDAHYSVLACFTTPRPLQHLRLKIRGYCAGERKRDVINSLSYFRDTLTSLSVEGVIGGPHPNSTHIIRSLAEKTPMLKLLSLNDFPFADPKVVQVDDDDCLLAVSQFQQLECLVLSELTRVLRLTKRRRIATAHRIFGQCPTLRFVVISGERHYLYKRHVDGITEDILEADDDDSNSLYAVHLHMASLFVSHNATPHDTQHRTYG
ncbi:hypothetical protein BDZ94DRAFT_1308206 [Collybia nuda]|uniref:F-box domain-containing protein n=1 Tax=Collybia nuda TaxID=64659 RepID=A0A9P5Y8L5_9AGAR|nr:hypothetical protein BDZ94DRAFT_1308206 [Collybia nuda]